LKTTRSTLAAQEGFKIEHAEKEEASLTLFSAPPHTHSVASLEKVSEVDLAAFIGLSQSEDGSPTQSGKISESLEHIRETLKRLSVVNARGRKTMADLQECLETEEGWMDCHEVMEKQGKGKERRVGGD
jgi:hypothetical protein